MSMEKSQGIFESLLKGNNVSLNESVSATLTSIESASKSAQELNTAFFKKYYPDRDPKEPIFKGAQFYWLPNVPSRTQEEMEEYLRDLMSDETKLREALQQIYEHLVVLHGALNQIKQDADPVIADHVKNTPGYINNLTEDLKLIFEYAGWKWTARPEFKVPAEQIIGLDKTHRASRNSLIIQSLLEVTNELMTFKNFKP